MNFIEWRKIFSNGNTSAKQEAEWKSSVSKLQMREYIHRLNETDLVSIERAFCVKIFEHIPSPGASFNFKLQTKPSDSVLKSELTPRQLIGG